MQSGTAKSKLGLELVKAANIRNVTTFRIYAVPRYNTDMTTLRVIWRFRGGEKSTQTSHRGLAEDSQSTHTDFTEDSQRTRTEIGEN